MSGRILSLEGLDGSGKTTQADALCRVLTERGLPYRRIKFPDYSDPSSTLVKMYLAGELGGQADVCQRLCGVVFLCGGPLCQLCALLGSRIIFKGHTW